MERIDHPKRYRKLFSANTDLWYDVIGEVGCTACTSTPGELDRCNRKLYTVKYKDNIYKNRCSGAFDLETGER